MLERMRANPETSYLGLMLALTFSTGVIDAVGYLGLDRVFTGNMTGNVVVLGMGLAGADNLPVLGPAVALAAFMTGAAIGGRVLRGSRDGWTGKHTALFGGVAGVLLAGAITVLLVTVTERSLLAYSVTASMGLAMGCQAATARHIAVKDVTTVVVTSTITSLASDSAFGKGGGQPWARRAGAVVLIMAGAGTGALLLKAHLGGGLLLSAVITMVVLALGHTTRPGRGPRVPYDGVLSQG
ncbi:YoaK family protein [Demequina capsici]|uniref:YoaK family protein n=1 Tax=Demequina capsici TaxID=3075620 RepID=A0AA96F4F6_9MICO|nr:MULTISPECIES: YoaK family protein [unclassified Demequina]WNM23718.1 YoaK family protein [Demequina sp. OYTSA14]WNM26557.1 YoaK family protein [Demequina sp. PMTSA13]